MEIVREIELDASPEDVWEALTDETQLEEWFANDVELDPTPGGRGVFPTPVVRRAWRREVLSSDGAHYPLPYPGGMGLGKPIKLTLHPLRDRIPILLGAEGPKNVTLATEIADGWLPIFYHVERGADVYSESLAGAPDGFQICCPVTVSRRGGSQNRLEPHSPQKPRRAPASLRGLSIHRKPRRSVSTRSSRRAAVLAETWPCQRRHSSQWQMSTSRSGPRTS